MNNFTFNNFGLGVKEDVWRMSLINYNSLTVAQLRDVLRIKNQKLSGKKKADLIER